MEMTASSDKPKLCLVVLVGLPGAGKTTFSKQLQKFLTEKKTTSEFGVINVCYDQLLLLSKQKEMALTLLNKKDAEKSLTDDKTEPNFKACRRNIVLMADDLICKFKGNLQEKGQSDNLTLDGEKLKGKESVLLVIDDNNYYQSMRYEYYQLARQHTVGFCQIYLKPNCIETVLSNNQKRIVDEQIPDEVITKMSSKIEPPNPFQNAWEQFSFSISVEGVDTEMQHNLYNMETCLDVIKAAIDNPVQPLPPTPPDKTEEAKAKSRNVCSTNVYHKSDKILRLVKSWACSTKSFLIPKYNSVWSVYIKANQIIRIFIFSLERC